MSAAPLLCLATSSVLVVCLGASCKKSEPAPEAKTTDVPAQATPESAFASEAIARMTELRDRMCACKDKACVTEVQQAMDAWSKELTKKGTQVQGAGLSQAAMREASQLSYAYADCMTRASSAPGAVDAGVSDAARADVPPPPANPLDATAALRAANIWARDTYRSAVGFVEVKYVDKDGMLDPDDGELRINYGVDRSDDPKRRTGAPVKEPKYSDACFHLILKQGAWTRRANAPCSKSFRAPTCSLAELWQRALAAKAPPDAVAILTLDDASGKPAWLFRVKDTLRDVNFARVFDDDCPIEVEK